MQTKQKRLDYYNPSGDLSDVQTTGLIACAKDFDYGTPNLRRAEDLTFIGAHTSLSSCLMVQLKWRPNNDGRLVTVLSRLTLVLDGEVHEFEQIETYQPSESSLQPGRYTQYGSSASKLKIFVPQPYRRTRIVFTGHMRRVSDNALVFVKLGCVVNPAAQVFDFFDRYDEQCLKEIYARKKQVRTLNQIVSNLLLHDRHEQKVRLAGEYLLIGQDNVRKQASLSLFGFYARHFSLDSSGDGGNNNHNNNNSERNMTTHRLYGYMNNGQAFHLGRRKFDLDEVEFGYTSFQIHPKTDPIDKPYKLDWQQLEGDKFELEVSGQHQTFPCTGQRKFADWFAIEMNGKPGWGWHSRSDAAVSTPEEVEAISRSQEERRRAIDEGRLMAPVEPVPLDSQPPLLVVSIGEEPCQSSQLVGSKAASLAQLARLSRADHRAGCVDFKVPFGFVLTKFAHDLILGQNDELRERISELQHFVGQGNELDLQLRERCKALAELVAKQVKLPEQIRADFWAKLTKHYGNEMVDHGNKLAFAVRSSSWGEDEDGMSAAGQLSTNLNVPFEADALSQSIMSCFASKFNYENIEYKRQHGLPLDLPMAVVVQEMVSCEKAGVMFTCEPTTGDESRVIITANFGLGESVVSAQADPDSITVKVDQMATSLVDHYHEAEDKLEIEKTIVGQKKVIISGLNGDQSQQDKSKCCLADEEILRLARCGLEIKRYFESQQRDIEWGYLNNQLYLFQSRPVTGLDSFSPTELLLETARPSQAELGYYTRANIGEVMPYAITPMTLTWTVFGWNSMGWRMFSRFGADSFYVPVCSGEVYHDKYHAFFNLRCSLLLPLSEAKRSVMGRALEIGFFGREMGVQPEIIDASKGFEKPPNPFQGTRFTLRTLPLKLMPNRTIMREKYALDKVRAEMRSMKLATGYEQNKMLGLYNQMLALMKNLYSPWENHICIIMFASNNNLILTAVLSKYIQDPMQLSAASNKFLAISPDVISAEIPARIDKMAKCIEAKGCEELKKFIEMNEDEAKTYLKNSYVELNQQFEEFMERFGHRCYNEFELAECAWRERPEMVVEMIRKNCAGLLAKQEEKSNQPDSTTGGGGGAEAKTSRPSTIDEVIKSLGVEISFKDRMLIKHVLAPKCQQTLAMREKTKNILIFYADILREGSRMLAEEMQRQLRIPDKDLFYYLMFDEVEPLIRDHQPAVVCQAIRRRQMFKRDMGQPWKFDEIISDMTPNHLKPTKELDEAISQAPKLFGTPASSGKVQGKICLVDGYRELDKVKSGTILLTHSTDIAFSPVFPLISGIITEVGGLISHGAVVAREYGLPSVIGIPDVTRILQDGEEIILDADNGAIIRLSKRDEVAN